MSYVCILLRDLFLLHTRDPLPPLSITCTRTCTHTTSPFTAHIHTNSFHTWAKHRMHSVSLFKQCTVKLSTKLVRHIEKATLAHGDTEQGPSQRGTLLFLSLTCSSSPLHLFRESVTLTEHERMQMSQLSTSRTPPSRSHSHTVCFSVWQEQRLYSSLYTHTWPYLVFGSDCHSEGWTFQSWAKWIWKSQTETCNGILFLIIIYLII